MDTQMISNASFWPASINDWGQLATYIIAIAAAIASVCQYYRNSKRERTRWLFDLYRRFYEEGTLKDMRVRVDWGDTAFVSAEDKKDAPLFGDLDNFLNFFEFVAILKKRKQLKPEEVAAMFEYPLKTIAANGAVLAYVKKYGYQELDALLKDLRYAS